jgi:CRISPR type IV-associated protein Csf1
MKYPSDIIDSPFRIPRDEGLLHWEGSTAHCTHCARPIESGDHYSPSAVGQFFSDSRDLTGHDRVICWRCVILRKKPMLYGLGATVITHQGAFAISKDVHKAWLFCTPPPAPFLVLHSSSTMQHLSWRTPVTLDNRLIMVRFGTSLFTVRPEYINKALAIADAYNEGQKKWRTPLILDRKAQLENHGRLTRAAEQELPPENAAFLANLSQGECWALAYLMHSKRPQPASPENITEKILSKFK